MEQRITDQLTFGMVKMLEAEIHDEVIGIKKSYKLLRTKNHERERCKT